MGKVMAVAAAMLIALCGISFSGSNGVARVAVHVMEHASRTCSKNFPSITECEDIVYSTDSTDADCFPVFLDLVEYQGFDYGLTWPGTYSCAFTSCSDLTIGSIVDPGDGVSHAWYTCQNGDIAVPGWGWISEPDPAQVCVCVHDVTYTINIGDCSGAIDHPAYAPYCAGIAGGDGDNPCSGPTATDRSTWGTIKNLFR